MMIIGLILLALASVGWAQQQPLPVPEACVPYAQYNALLQKSRAGIEQAYVTQSTAQTKVVRKLQKEKASLEAKLDKLDPHWRKRK